MKKFSEVSVYDESLVGTKAYRLADLEKNGFPVPCGMVLTIPEVQKIESSGIVSLETLEAIRKEFGAGMVSVRSTAYGEDGELSWAGQFRSHLYVTPSDQARTIMCCARASKTEEVLAYARTHGRAVPPLALIVQRMIDAAYAGVIFTRDPVRNGNTFIIEAIKGVGAMLVDGRTEPCRFYVDSETGIVSKREGAEEPHLDVLTITRLIALAKRVRDHFACDQDIEWAIEKGTGELFVLQSRNITTAAREASDIGEARHSVISALHTALQHEALRLTPFVSTGADEDILSDQNIAEILTPHPSPMAFGLFTYIFADHDGAIRTGRRQMGYEMGDEVAEGFFRLVAGQPRCSIMHDAFTYRIKGIPLEDYMKVVRLYLSEIRKDPIYANYPEVVLYDQDPSLEFLRRLFDEETAVRYRSAYDSFFEEFQKQEDEFDFSCSEYFLPSWGGCIRKERTALDYTDKNDPKALATRFMRMVDILRTHACVAFVKTARFAFFTFTRLRNVLTEIAGNEAESFSNLVTAGSMAHNPNLSFNKMLFEMKHGRNSLNEVMDAFGHLGIHELEISTPRYRSLPDILQELAMAIEEDPFIGFKETIARSEVAQKQVLKIAGSRAEEVRECMNAARRYLPLREKVKFEFLKGYDILREIAVMLGRTLGIHDDIFLLYPQEIAELAHTGVCTAISKIADRKERLAIERSVFVPQVIDAAALDAIGLVEANAQEVLSGLGVTDSVVEGEVVVLRSLMDADARKHVAPGKILVTTTTDPAWSPVLSVIGKNGGLITEIGGLLAHGAIYAREMGLAAVLNVPHATERLVTGMRVRVSGPEGKIYIVQ